ncbi:MAG: hypothetical protein HY420_01520 [Candidatus Kerfeldbacteria bacterium]|nr:hypothetical protein [Candidatus Kerfeldbacteria bacterium]
MKSALEEERHYLTTSRLLVLSSLRSLAKQCRRGFQDARRVAFPRQYRSIEGVVVCGMGGSALGTDVLRSVYARELRVPLTIVNDYTLPAAARRQTLVVLSSYSGSTEEVLAASQEARRRKCLITGLTQGGALATLLRQYRVPWYQIDGSANPSGQPRMGLGYSIMGQLGLLTALGLMRVSQSEVLALTAAVEEQIRERDSGVPRKSNAAKQLAERLYGTIPVLVSGEHLVGSMHAWANMLNETAKTLAASFPLPELNHHLLEGLRYPGSTRQLNFVFADSSSLSQKLRSRLRITSQLVDRRHISTVVQRVHGQTLLEEAFDVLTLGGFVSFYLSILNHVDPLAIPTVDEFKRRLGRSG